MGIIYKATNKVNGKSYIGLSTQPLYIRKRQHYYHSLDMSRTYHFMNAIRKYGINGFVWTELYRTDDDSLLSEKEQEFIKKYNSYHEGYNSTYGGDGFTSLDTRGAENPRATITEEEALVIIEFLMENQLTLREIAEIVGCSLGVVKKINQGKSWRHLNYSSERQDLKHKPLGESNVKAKLSEDDVRELRSLHKEGYSYTELTEKFNVSRSTVSKIVLGHTWKHIAPYDDMTTYSITIKGAGELTQERGEDSI